MRRRNGAVAQSKRFDLVMIRVFPIGSVWKLSQLRPSVPTWPLIDYTDRTQFWKDRFLVTTQWFFFYWRIQSNLGEIILDRNQPSKKEKTESISYPTNEK